MNDNKLDNEQIFGTDDYEEVQKIYENFGWGRGYYYASFNGNQGDDWTEEWTEELKRRKLSKDK